MRLYKKVSKSRETFKVRDFVNTNQDKIHYEIFNNKLQNKTEFESVVYVV